MKTVELNKNDPRVAKFVRGYKGRRTIKVSEASNYHVADYFDGGSRDYVKFVDLSTGQYLTLSEVGFKRQTIANPYNLAIGEVEMKPGIAAVVNVIFCGKDLGYRIYFHPSDFTAFEG